MLVLTRKQRQQISVGDNITITVLKVKGQAVRIGIEAPDGVRILRAELNATEELSESEVPAVKGALQRTSQNARRSRLGSETDTTSDCEVSHSGRNDSGLPLERASLRMEPVSLLSFR